MGFHFLPSRTRRAAGCGFRLWWWRRLRSLGLDGGRRRRGLHNNALVSLRGLRSRRRCRDVHYLRSRLPLGAAAKNNGNAENGCFPAQGILILSLQQKFRAAAELPSGLIKNSNQAPGRPSDTVHASIFKRLPNRAGIRADASLIEFRPFDGSQAFSQPPLPAGRIDAPIPFAFSPQRPWRPQTS